VLGGSAQGAWQNMLLQLVGLGIIAWSAAATREETLPTPAKVLLILAIAAIALVALQDIPIPPALWNHGSRTALAKGFRLLGRPLPSLPISLSPYDSLTALLCLIPPLAMFCAIVRLKAYRPSWLAAALLLGAVAGIVLCALQVAAAGPNSPWYLYPETNYGVGVGFFANGNHMASLLVIAIPFVAAIAAAGKSRNIQRYSALLAILAGVVLILAVGIALNGSLAGYLLVLPVTIASAIIVLVSGRRLHTWLAIASALAVLASVAGLGASSIGAAKIGQDAQSSVQSRADILATTGKAIADYMPLGSGLGSFLRVYRLYESPDTVTNEYVVHAHDDYAELALEMGAPGIVLILLFLGWWAAAVWAVWRPPGPGPYARAASIASAAVLIHSLVDFPLRTAAISACFAMCLALLADRRTPQRHDPADLRPTRHLLFR
jgi:O-antigen ligase